MSDYISREAVKNIILGGISTDTDEDKEYVCGLIDNLPSVENKGEWRPVYQGDEIIDYRCNKCEFGSTFGRGKYRFNFCPNCGADMRGET